MKTSIALFRAAMAALVLVAASAAAPTLPTLFTDHMVLQRGREIHVWGSADPGEKITVSLAGKTANGTADPSGQWSVHLSALAAGGPFTLSVRGKSELVIKDVLIGEVWLASGQSNMTYALSGAEGGEAAAAQANFPEIRLFTVPRKIALSPQPNTRPVHWEICRPDTAKSFSAVAYFFARDLYRKLKVPIGIVESAWPGTQIQEWIAPDPLRADLELKPLADELDHATPEQRSLFADLIPFHLEFDDFELLPVDPDAPAKPLADFEGGSTQLRTGGTFSYSWDQAPDSSFELSSPDRDGHGFAAKVSGLIDGTEDSILAANYKGDDSAIDLSGYNGIRFWVRGDGQFRFRSKQPTIYDYDDYATPLIKATSEWKQVTIKFNGLRQDGWGVVQAFTQSALTGFSFECLTATGWSPRPVSGLYEGMITPLLPYEFRGALWYQGEGNALQAHQYRKLLPAMIKNWRENAHQPDLDFLIVQLPNHGAIPDEPSESAWAELREAQFLTAGKTAHTGLAVTIDVGDPKDLHPHRKLEIGQRLALWALGTTYKQPGEYSGPLYRSMRVDGNEMRLQFQHAASGLEARGSSLEGFAIAGEDRKFHWAQARIDGDSIVVSSPDVPKPVAVRYAWGDSPRCNLYNKAGLPASPFRTDDWPGITEGTQK